MQPATIKLFLVNGSPTGLRTAEISNWTGKAIAGPRSDLNSLLNRDELASPGIYLLTGTDPEYGEPVLYIGEAENVSKRLKQHAKNEEKDYWVHTSAFVSKDENLTKAHTRYIEGKLIQAAIASKRVVLMNSVSSGSSLPEADCAEMDVFIDRIQQLLPVLGIHHFTAASTTSVPASKPSPDIEARDQQPTFHLVDRVVKASGRRSEEGFVVFQGSQVKLETTASCPEGTIKIRQRLLEKGVIAQQGDSYFFTDDYEFSSPSAAGAFIKGRSTNGLTSWVTEDGTTLKKIEFS